MRIYASCKKCRRSSIVGRQFLQDQAKQTANFNYCHECENRARATMDHYRGEFIAAGLITDSQDDKNRFYSMWLTPGCNWKPGKVRTVIPGNRDGSNSQSSLDGYLVLRPFTPMDHYQPSRKVLFRVSPCRHTEENRRYLVFSRVQRYHIAIVLQRLGRLRGH